MESSRGEQAATDAAQAESGVTDKEQPDTGGLAIDNAEVTYPSIKRAIIIYCGLLMCLFLVALDQTIISTAIPVITNEWNALNDIAWYGSAYMLASTSLQLSYGKLYTVYRIKHVFLFAVVVFELGSLICGIAHSSSVFIIGRAIAGIGHSGIFSGTVTIISYLVPLRKRAIFFGIMGMLWGVSSVIGPLLGGTFTDHLTWRWCFFINLPIGAVAIAAVIYLLKLPSRDIESLSFREKMKTLDFIGFAFLLSGIVCLLLALQWGGTQYAWSSAHIIGLLVGFGVLIICFCAVQGLLGERATVPIRIINNRTVISACVFSAGFGAYFFMLMYFIPVYFQAVRSASATGSGIRLLPMIISLVIVSSSIGVLISAYGRYKYFSVVGSFVSAVGIGLMSLWNVDTPPGEWIGFQILIGLGAGTGFSIPSLAIQSTLKHRDIPVGAALSTFFLNLGGAIWIAVGQNLFTNALVREITANAPNVSPHSIIHAGATNVVKIVPSEQMRSVLIGYAAALRMVWYCALGPALVAAIACLFYKNLKIGKSVAKPRGLETQ